MPPSQCCPSTGVPPVPPAVVVMVASVVVASFVVALVVVVSPEPLALAPPPALVVAAEPPEAGASPLVSFEPHATKLAHSIQAGMRLEFAIRPPNAPHGTRVAFKSFPYKRVSPLLRTHSLGHTPIVLSSLTSR